MPFFNVRWMIRLDMPEVYEIERECSPHDAWSEEDFLRCLRTRNVVGMTAQEGDHTRGFMVYELHKNKLHLLNFAVHPNFRRMGVGTAMTNKLINKLSARRRSNITLHIRESNLDGLLFFRKQGFAAVKPLLRMYFENPDEDGYIMQYDYFKHEGINEPHPEDNEIVRLPSNRIFGSHEAA